MYNYVTKCLYRSSPSYPHAKSIQVLLKSIAYFDIKELRLPCDDGNLKLQVKSRFSNIHFEGHPYDILYFSKSETEKALGMLSKDDYVHNQSLLLLEGIHEDTKSEEQWNRIITHKKARVTVDMYHCGAIFLRNEQAKEHFKIRI